MIPQHWPLAKMFKGQGIKILPQRNPAEIYRYCLRKSKLGTLLKIFRMRSDKLSIYCIGQNKFQRKYTMIYEFMNSDNSKTSDAYRLRLNLTDEIGLRRGDNRVG